MTSDERIKKELHTASRELDELMSENEGITGYLKLGFQSSTGKLVRLGYALAIVLTLLMFFTGLQILHRHARWPSLLGRLPDIEFQCTSCHQTVDFLTK